MLCSRHFLIRVLPVRQYFSINEASSEECRSTFYEMKERLLDYLACPSCAGEIKQLSVTKSEAGEIIEGRLECADCNQRFPITRGIPRFAETSEIESDKALTAEKFGWSWQHFDHQDPLYGEQFLGWLAPVRPEFFAGKVPLISTGSIILEDKAGNYSRSRVLDPYSISMLVIILQCF